MIGRLLYTLYTYSCRVSRHAVVHADVGRGRRMSVNVGTQLYACMVCFCLSVSRESWIAKLRLRLLLRRLCQGHAESRRQEAPRPVAWHHGPA